MALKGLVQSQCDGGSSSPVPTPPPQSPCTTQGSPFHYLETLRITIINRVPRRSSERQISSSVALFSCFAPTQHSAVGAWITILLQGRTRRIREAEAFAQGHTAAECEGMSPGLLILGQSSQISSLPAALTHPEPYFCLSIYSTHVYESGVVLGTN